MTSANVLLDGRRKYLDSSIIMKLLISNYQNRNQKCYDLTVNELQ